MLSKEVGLTLASIWMILQGGSTAAQITKTASNVTRDVAHAILPLSFEPNEGQANPEVEFVSRGGGYVLFLTLTEAVLVLRDGSDPLTTAVLRIRRLGGEPRPKIVGLDALPGHANYFIGNDVKQWTTGIPLYAKVRYADVYPGVDMVYYGNRGQLEFDFILSRGASPETILLGFKGAEVLELEPTGELVARTAAGEVRMRKPRLYQEEDGVVKPVSGQYAIRGRHQVGFQVGEYDRGNSLTIDPVLAYSTYLGGSGQELGFGIKVDGSGNAYVTGTTHSLDFPTMNPVQGFLQGGSNDAFVAKLSADGSTLLYSTYLGGSGNDQGFDIAVDDSDNAYVTGETQSADFPLANPIQGTLAGAEDAFVAKLDATGSSLVYSTYLGGADQMSTGLTGDKGFGIAIDGSGSAYVTGHTQSTDFPTLNAFQSTYGGGGLDGFVTKIRDDGLAIVYSTYLGGSGADGPADIDVDSSGNAHVTGATGSSDFPTANPIQATKSASDDVFITKLDATGTTLVFSTYLGGNSTDTGLGVAVDGLGNVHVAGATESSDFPAVNALQGAFGGGVIDPFVAKLSPTGSSIVYSTYFGGTGLDYATGVGVDDAGNAYITGTTQSSDFPTADPLQATFQGGTSDAFVAKLSADGSGISYSTYLGGSGSEIIAGGGIAVDDSGSAYVVGETASTDFPTENAFQAALNGGAPDAFISKIAAVFSVTIDIKPGRRSNRINAKSKGVIPVAILTTDSFDAAGVEASTVRFGPNQASPTHAFAHLEDVDGDGDVDLLLHFRTPDTGIQCGDTGASLSGQTLDGQQIAGSDRIRTIPCKADVKR